MNENNLNNNEPFSSQVIQLIQRLNETADVFNSPFQGLRNRYETIRQLLNSIPQGLIFSGSKEAIKNLFINLEGLVSNLSDIRIYQIYQNNDYELKDEYIKNFSDLFKKITDDIDNLSNKNSENDALRKFEGEIALKKKELDSALFELDQTRKEFENLQKITQEKVEAIPDNIAEKIAFKPLLKKYAEQLKLNELSEFDRQSRNNFKYLILTALVLMVYLIAGYEIICDEIFFRLFNSLNNGEWKNLIGQDLFSKFVLTSILISKISIFLILLYLLYFFGRNYAIYRHNFIVLQHRIYSMLAYEEFISQTHITSDTRNEITRHAGSAIFSPIETGFLKNGSEKINLSVPGFMNLGHSSEK